MSNKTCKSRRGVAQKDDSDHIYQHHDENNQRGLAVILEQAEIETVLVEVLDLQ